MAMKTGEDVDRFAGGSVYDAVGKSGHERATPVAPKFGVSKRILFDAG